jgi:para-nitrobenzyl esterase
MSSVVTTRSGRLEAQVEDSLHVFRGIPYAEPPIGDLRFCAPQPVKPWSGVLEARNYGPYCPQLPDPVQQRIWALSGESGEDCLTLNVWTPGIDRGRRPVMVWIHGGAFVVGAARRPVTEGAALARRGDVVVVTLNYRLGILGWLNLEDHGGPNLARSGNHGLLDQVAALQWVRDNIEQFGGDPENITVFGESAGGISVSVLLSSELGRGLFHKAVAQSGAPNLVRSRDQSRELAMRFLKIADAKDAYELQRLGLEDLLRAQEKLFQEVGFDVSFGPVMDGTDVPHTALQAMENGAGETIPLLAGTTLDEFRYWHLEDPSYATLGTEHLRNRLDAEVPAGADQVIKTYKASRPHLTENELALALITDIAFRIGHVRMAEARARRGASTWMYLITWSTPVMEGKLGSPHAIDLPFVFGNLDVPNVHELTGDAPERQELAAAMQDAWIAFARSGDPRHRLLPQWPLYDLEDRAVMRFDLPCELLQDPYPEEREVWKGVPFDGLRPSLTG